MVRTSYLLTLGLALVLLAGAAAAEGYVVYSRVHQPFRSYSAAEQFVDIAPGTSPAAIGRALVGAGVVRDAVTFRAALWLSGNEIGRASWREGVWDVVRGGW